MDRRMSFIAVLVVGFVAGAIVGSVAGIFLFIRAIGGSGEPSAPITAPTLDLSAITTMSDSAPQAAQIVTPTPPPTVTPAPRPARLFRIVPEESEARFLVDELRPLMTAIGRTRQVAGDILVDFERPANSRLGVVRINLRTLRTGDADRDAAIRGGILLSARPEYEFSDFTPTAINGLPDTVIVGEPVNFQVVGDLPLRGITHSLTFEVTVTVLSETELKGLATTQINRHDYGLLNDGLLEHGVSETVRLELEFVARAVARVETPTPIATRTPATTRIAACAPTPTASRGSPPNTPDAPLRAKVGTGHILSGVVRSSRDCAPLADAVLVFWWAGPDGLYDDAHTAKVVTDREGKYRLESNYPGQYENVAAHIHLYIYAAGHRGIETEYLPGGRTAGTLDIVLAPLPPITATPVTSATSE